MNTATYRGLLWGAIAVSVLLGVVAGLGGYTFVYARGASYMTDDPAACANCHVMTQQLTGWQKSSHKGVAVCNDCHTPHGFFAKYFTKALNGWNHASAFTTGDFHEPIQITARNRAITESKCRGCHAELTASLSGPHADPEATSCIRCHDSVGHLAGD
jgi:cytochrome c nitrite reductase small subunit